MTSRFLIPIILLAAAAGCRGSSQTAAPPASTPPASMAANPSSGGVLVTASVVTVDTSGPSVTLREGDVPAGMAPRSSDLKTGDRTIRVEPAAAASLSGIKPGDLVQVTCSPAQAAMTTGPGGTAAGTSAAGGTGHGGMGTSAEAMGTGLAGCDSVVAIALAGGSSTGR